MTEKHQKPSLAEFQATKVRCTFRSLIKDGHEPAATFIGIEPIELLEPETEHVKKLLDIETLAYSMPTDSTEPNLFIGALPNGDYNLLIGSEETQASNEYELAKLEAELYEWGLTETGTEWATPTDDEDKEDSPSPR